MAVSERDAGRACGVAMLDQPHDVVDARDVCLLDADDLYLLLPVLQHAQLLLPVQQVEHLPAGTTTSST